MLKKEGDVICPLVWNHHFIDARGKTKVCCRHKGNTGDINYKDLKSIFYNNYMNTIRSQMKRGIRPEGCRRCWEEEDSGKISLRQRYQQVDILNTLDINNPTIEWLELAISNDCNIMCRMCSSEYSSMLFDEEKEYYNITKSQEKHTKIDIKKIYPYIHTLKHLKITGGEPFITTDHWRLLKYIILKKQAKHIYLNYSTNGTIYPTTKMINIWKQFKHIEINISLDSIIKKEQEYIRYGTNYDKFISNFMYFINLKKEMSLKIFSRPTVSILNIYHLPETLDWLHSLDILVNPTHLTYPTHLSITTLPLKLKKIIEKRFKNYNYIYNSSKIKCLTFLNYMISDDTSNNFSEFIKHTRFLDAKRGQNAKEIYPYFDF